MNNKLFAYILTCTIVLLVACGEKKKNNNVLKKQIYTQEQSSDTTIYGVCGEGTAMHTLELITDQGDTITYMVDIDSETKISGGMLAGDRLAVVAHKNSEGENVADGIINITSLMGKWVSIDKNFEIQEGGTIKSNIEAETNPWTAWKIYNGKLILNKDTFTINELGADSMYIENANGIYAYKRIK